jgi:hypothetical protein
MELKSERELPQPVCELWRALEEPDQLRDLIERLRIRSAEPSPAHCCARASGDSVPIRTAQALLTQAGATRRLVTQFALRTPGPGGDLPVRLILLLRETGRATTMTTVVRIRPPGLDDEGPDPIVNGIAADIADGIASAIAPS